MNCGGIGGGIIRAGCGTVGGAIQTAFWVASSRGSGKAGDGGKYCGGWLTYLPDGVTPHISPTAFTTPVTAQAGGTGRGALAMRSGTAYGASVTVTSTHVSSAPPGPFRSTTRVGLPTGT